MNAQNNEIEIMNVCERECGICYEEKRWGCDGGDFIEGTNCEHMVCTDCSVKIHKCPFCRQVWHDEEEEDATPFQDLFAELVGRENAEEEEQPDLFAELVARANTEEQEEETLTIEELVQSISTLSQTYHQLTARLETETDMEQIEATNRTLIDTLELLLGVHNRVERLMGVVARENSNEDETDQPERNYLAQEAEEYAQEEHIGQYPDHQYCHECGCCIGCGCCDCGEEEQNEL